MCSILLDYDKLCLSTLLLQNNMANIIMLSFVLLHLITDVCIKIMVHGIGQK